MVERVEGLGERFHSDSFAERERAAEAQVYGKKIVADAGVSGDELAIDHGPRRSSLNGGGAGGDVEGKRRVILQHAAELESVREALPVILSRGRRGLQCAVEDYAVALIIIGAAVIKPDI